MPKQKRARRTRDKGVLMRRIFAFLLDLFILNVVIISPFHMYVARIFPTGMPLSYNMLMTNEAFLSFFTPMVFFIVLYTFTYFVLLEYAISQTVGKIILNLKIESAKKRLTFMQCIIRSLFIIPLFPLTLLWVIDPLFLFFISKDGQRLSEYISKTWVVDSRWQKET